MVWDVIRRMMRREVVDYSPDLGPVIEADEVLQDAKTRIRGLQLRADVFTRSHTGGTTPVTPAT